MLALEKVGILWCAVELRICYHGNQRQEGACLGDSKIEKFRKHEFSLEFPGGLFGKLCKEERDKSSAF